MKKLIFKLIGLIAILSIQTFAQEGGLIIDSDSLFSPSRFSTSLNVLFSVAIVGFVPFLLMSTTCFIRVVIILGMIRGAIGTQQEQNEQHKDDQEKEEKEDNDRANQALKDK